MLGEELLERFDVIGWDPRGTGFSEPAVDCIDDYDEYYAGYDITRRTTPSTKRSSTSSRTSLSVASTTTKRSWSSSAPTTAPATSDSIRRALGEDKISYFGFSYGSELGATWATLFPETVRAAVLDGASDPTVDPLQDSLQQTAGFEAALTRYLAQCSDDPECAFHNDGDAEGAFDTLMAELDENPIPSEEGRPDIDLGVALQAVAEAMYTDEFWEQLSEALDAAQNGDGSGLLALWDAYYHRQPDGTWINFLEAFQVIRCMDQVARRTVEEDDAAAIEFNEVAPASRRGPPASTSAPSSRRASNRVLTSPVRTRVRSS